MQLPNARREGLIVEELAEETLVYDLDTHKAHSLNPSAALVWRHCDGRTNVRELAQVMHDELKAPVSEDLVMLALDRLQTAKLLAEPVDSGRHVSRRSVMKKLALTGGLAVLLPAIHSIIAPTPAQAPTPPACNGTPCPPGQTLCAGAACSSNSQCCSNNCDQFLLTCVGP